MTKKNSSYNDLAVRQANERKQILDMIDASCELAAKKGLHPLEKGCSCIACVNKRKRLLDPGTKTWKYRL